MRIMCSAHTHTYMDTNVLWSNIFWHKKLVKEKWKKVKHIEVLSPLSRSLSSFQTTPLHGKGPNPKSFVCVLAFPYSLYVYPLFYSCTGSFSDIFLSFRLIQLS